MTLAYDPAGAPAERLDPRAKLAFQVAFAICAFAHTTPRGLALLSVLALLALAAAATPPLSVLSEFRYVFVFLAGSPLFAALTLGPPWVVPEDAIRPLLSSYRVLLVLCVSAAYVRTTPVRESRAAIQHLVPGRTGQFLGITVASVVRFLPILRADLRAVRDATAVRLGDERPLHERMQVVATAGLARAFERSDRFALALRARCFAWNPTLPSLSFGRRDAFLLTVSLALVTWSL